MWGAGDTRRLGPVLRDMGIMYITRWMESIVDRSYNVQDGILSLTLGLSLRPHARPASHENYPVTSDR